MDRLIYKIRDRLARETGIFFSPRLIQIAVENTGLSIAGQIRFVRLVANAGESTKLIRGFLMGRVGK